MDWNQELLKSAIWIVKAFVGTGIGFAAVVWGLTHFTRWGRQFRRLAWPYFTPRRGWRPFLMLALILFLTMFSVRMNVLFSFWYNGFYSALQALDQQGAHGSGWNFRQFALAPRRRGAGALREAWRRLREPALRPVRWGLAALVAVQLVGLNAWAWQERQALQSRREAMVALLQQTHPEVRTVLDAPRQMARQTEALRAAAGRPGEADLETLRGVAAGVWPPGLAPASALRFERGRLMLGAPGWDAARVAAVREPLQAAGWAVSYVDGQLTLSRAPQEGR